MEELLEELGKLIDDSKKKYYTYQQAKMREDMKRDEVLQYMYAQKLLSARTADFTASVVSKPIIEIRHEQSVLDYLENEPNLEIDQFVGIKLTEFKKYAIHKLKETGEEIPGTDVSVREYLSIKRKDTK